VQYRNLLVYWLALAVIGMSAFIVPVVGFAFAIGALLYFLYAIGYWLLFAVSLHARPRSRLAFGMARRTFALRLAIGAGVVFAGSLLIGWKVLACLAAALLYYCGESVIKDRMIAAAGGYSDGYLGE